MNKKGHAENHKHHQRKIKGRHELATHIELGSILNTEEQIIEQVIEFEGFLHQSIKRQSFPWESFQEWASNKRWYQESSSDIGPVWDAYVLRLWGNDKIQARIQEIIERLDQSRLQTHTPDSEIQPTNDPQTEFVRLKPGVTMQEFDAVCEKWNKEIAPKAIDPDIQGDQDRHRAFLIDAKKLKRQMADMQIGKRLCKNAHCIKYIPSSRSKRAEYCSEDCKKKERARRNRQKNPKAKMRSDLKYLRFLEEEGDLND